MSFYILKSTVVCLYIEYTVCHPCGMFFKFPKVLVVKTVQLCTCSVLPHTRPDPGDFSPLHCELWPLEKCPLTLTGPNGAERTAGDRRQMETHIHVKADAHVLATLRHTNRVEGVALQAWGVTGEPQGRTRTQSSTYTGNCWDMQVMPVSMFINTADMHRHPLYATSFLCLMCCWANFWPGQHCLFD